VEVARQRYLFAAFFSTGLMIPAGFEYGSKKKLHVVNTTPDNWETPAYDLSAHIAQVNRMKSKCPVLLEEGPIGRDNQPPGPWPVVFLLKSRENRQGRVLAVINTTRQEQPVELSDLPALLGEPASGWQDLTPDMVPLKLEPSLQFTLAPSRLRLFYNPKGKALSPEELEKLGAKPDEAP